MIDFEPSIAQPAPFIVTSRASDVITFTSLTFCPRLTLRTVHEVRVCLCIFKELFILCPDCDLVLAFVSRMPLHATLKAHFVAACADRGLITLRAFLDIIKTTWPRTPPQLGIHVHLDFLVEAQVLAVNVL